LINNIRDARPRLGRCGIISPRRCFSSHVQGEILILQKKFDWVLENGGDELTFDINIFCYVQLELAMVLDIAHQMYYVDVVDFNQQGGSTWVLQHQGNGGCS
jgi:hypothetical protein